MHEIPMADALPTIFVVDDDASVRDTISNLLESVGLRAKVFESTEAGLHYYHGHAFSTSKNRRERE
jgi:FixJ family two-component response regulator